jgi:hypothetical protein
VWSISFIFLSDVISDAHAVNNTFLAETTDFKLCSGCHWQSGSGGNCQRVVLLIFFACRVSLVDANFKTQFSCIFLYPGDSELY